MHNGVAVGLALLLCGVARADTAPEAVVEETWEAVFLDDVQAGFSHTTVRQVERDGHKRLVTSVDLQLTVKQGKDRIVLRMETGSTETADGRITSVSLRHYTNQDTRVTLTGTVSGEQLHLVGKSSVPMDRKLAWNSKALSPYGERRLLQQRADRAGDRFSYVRFEPTLSTAVTVRVAVQEIEEVEVLGKRTRLRRLEATPDRVDGVQLPREVYWVEKEAGVRRWQTELPGLGQAVFYRTTADLAQAPLTDVPALESRRRILLNRRLDRPYDAEVVVYHVMRTGAGKDDITTLFATDARQRYARIRDNSFELRVQRLRPPEQVSEASQPDREYLSSCPYINSDDARVQELARKAVGAETDPWKQALRIEAWVHANMRMTDPTGDFLPADQVARQLRGNVSEYAFLAAAMARAVGVPSRTALGLVYDDADGEPALRYHMWTEVWARGQWLPIDATLGRGSIGAAHLKISDDSWHDVKSLTPLTPLLRVWGKIEVEVVSVKEGK